MIAKRPLTRIKAGARLGRHHMQPTVRAGVAPIGEKGSE
jgi:hypothetical protein